MEYVRSENGSVNLVCKTSNSPPTSIKWYRDSTPLEIDGDSTDLSVRVTNRGSAYFEISLSVCDSPDGVVGNYTCKISNRFGNGSRSHELRGGIAIIAIGGP